jgi:hypothetical protein
MRFKQFYRESLIRSNPYSRAKVAYHESLIECLGESFSEDGVSGKEEVVDAITNDKWEKASPQAFRASLMKSKHKEMLTDYSISELSKMKIFKVPNYDIGFALKDHDGEPFSEIVAVHNNSPIKGIGAELTNATVRNGGKYLDHFDVGILSNLYSSAGFVEYKRDPYNPQYDTNGDFKNKYGPVDVVYRVYKGG